MEFFILQRHWIISLLRNLFFLIDWLVYAVFGGLYSVFIELSSKTVFSQEVVKSFTSRIYVLVGIIMLFKLAFSLVNMFVNPDTFNDSQVGAGKLVQKAVIALVLLVLTPVIFTEAYNLQDRLIKANIIGKLLIGEENVAPVEEGTMGSNISANLFSAFFFESTDSENKEQAFTMSQFGEIWINVNQANEDGKGYRYNYWFILSTAAGVIMILMMFQFILDIAIRIFKLAFLQMIAPIPIILSIDPKKDEQLKSWAKACLKTYISLFIKIAAIYFVIYLLHIIMQDGGLTLYELDGVTKATEKSGWNVLLYPLVFIGLFMFAKELPKLIEQILGIKLDGDFTLNPAKRMKESGFGTPLGALAAGTTFARSMKNGDGWRKALSQSQENYKNKSFTPSSIQKQRDAAYDAKYNEKRHQEDIAAGKKYAPKIEEFEKNDFGNYKKGDPRLGGFSPEFARAVYEKKTEGKKLSEMKATARNASSIASNIQKQFMDGNRDVSFTRNGKTYQGEDAVKAANKYAEDAQYAAEKQQDYVKEKAQTVKNIANYDAETAKKFAQYDAYSSSGAGVQEVADVGYSTRAEAQETAHVSHNATTNNTSSTIYTDANENMSMNQLKDEANK